MLVALAFVPNPKNRPEVNHKDGVKTNSAASNLEWVTPRGNRQHASRLGLNAHGERNGGAVLSEDDVRAIRRLLDEDEREIQDIAAEFGVSRRTVSLIGSRKAWAHVQ